VTGAAPTYEVRPAVPDDAVRLGEVHVAVWHEAYAGIMPTEYLAGLDPARLAATWAERLAAPQPGTVVLVGTADGAVVGFATAGPSQDPEPGPPAQLFALNVLAAHHGTGLADRLLDAALAPVAGDHAVGLWVAEVNARARAFYGRHGFAPDGGTMRHEATGVPLVRLVRPAR
jgi:GNAT superfamily N-acetyltransferase